MFATQTGGKRNQRGKSGRRAVRFGSSLPLIVQFQRIPIHSMNNSFHPLLDRRRFLQNSSNALSSIALASLLSRDRMLAQDPANSSPNSTFNSQRTGGDAGGTPGGNPVGTMGGNIELDPRNPYAPRLGHFDAKAKNVLVVFCCL